MIPVPIVTMNGKLPELPMVQIAETQLLDLTERTAQRRKPTPLELAASDRLEAALSSLNPHLDL